MEPKSSPDIQVVDKRRLHNADGPASQTAIPKGRRAHSVLLGYCPEDKTRSLLADQDLDETTCNELLDKRARAQARIQQLANLDVSKPAAAAITDRNSSVYITSVLQQPECKAGFPEDTWSPLLVEIAKLIPLEPNLDVEYAERTGDNALDPAQPASAVRLCFTSRPTGNFQIRADQEQKAFSVSGISPSLEVVGLRYSQQPESGMVLVSFMISPPPNLVAVTHHDGRYFLLNGHHRVYRLMQAGFTQVPCMVRDGAPYGQGFFTAEVLTAPRPPLFCDFADPTLGITVPFRALKRVVRIRPDEYFVPE